MNAVDFEVKISSVISVHGNGLQCDWIMGKTRPDQRKLSCVSLSHQETACSPCVSDILSVKPTELHLIKNNGSSSLWIYQWKGHFDGDTFILDDHKTHPRSRDHIFFLSFCLHRIQSEFDRMWLRQIFLSFLSLSVTDPAFTKSCEWSSTHAAQSILTCERIARRAVGQLICLSCVITFGKLTLGIDACWFGTAQLSTAQLKPHCSSCLSVCMRRHL